VIRQQVGSRLNQRNITTRPAQEKDPARREETKEAPTTSGDKRHPDRKKRGGEREEVRWGFGEGRPLVGRELSSEGGGIFAAGKGDLINSLGKKIVSGRIIRRLEVK